MTRLASNKIHREVGRAKDLSAPLYSTHWYIRDIDLLSENFCGTELQLQEYMVHNK